jgi:hypothetical protein
MLHFNAASRNSNVCTLVEEAMLIRLKKMINYSDKEPSQPNLLKVIVRKRKTKNGARRAVYEVKLGCICEPAIK